MGRAMPWWDGHIVTDTSQEKRVRMQTVEPLTGLKHQIDYAIRTKDPFFMPIFR